MVSPLMTPTMIHSAVFLLSNPIPSPMIPSETSVVTTARTGRTLTTVARHQGEATMEEITIAAHLRTTMGPTRFHLEVVNFMETLIMVNIDLIY